MPTISFSVREYATDILVIRTKTSVGDEITPGIPPSHSQCIAMDPDEIDELIETLKDYANKRRNT